MIDDLTRDAWTVVAAQSFAGYDKVRWTWRCPDVEADRIRMSVATGWLLMATRSTADGSYELVVRVARQPPKPATQGAHNALRRGNVSRDQVR